MIDYDRVELFPAANTYFDSGAEPAALSPQSGQPDRDLAYAVRAAAYEAALPELYKLRWGRSRGKQHPEHEVRLAGRTETVSYDAGLWQQLLRIYLMDGWAGIIKVQDALRAASKSRSSAPLHPWRHAISFFGFTRNLLALAIREALVGIERKAADRLVLELSLSARLVNDSRAKVRLRDSELNSEGETEKMIIGGSPSWDSPARRNRTFYSFGDTELSARLYPLMQRAVQFHAEKIEQRVLTEHRQAVNRAMRDEIGSSLPYSLEQLPAEAFARLAELEELSTVETERIHRECPLAVLAVPMLKPCFGRPEMEQRIGECLAAFYQESERIAAAYSQGTSKVSDLIPGDRPEVSPETLYGPEFAPEKTVAHAALQGALRDPGWLAMMSERLLRLLVDHGQVEFDTFEYMVLMHYITVLQTALIAETALVQALDRLVAKVTALLSLALWVIPAGRVLKAVSALLGLSVVSFQTLSVVHQLAIIDREFSVKMAELDRTSAAEVAVLAELALARPGMLAELSQAVIEELTLIVAAGAAAQFRHLLHLRGVYLDLATLIGD